MKFKALSLFSVLATLMVSGTSFAASVKNPAVKSSAPLTQQPEQLPLFDGFITGARSTSLYDFQDGTRKDAMEYSARVNFNLTKNYVLRIDGGYAQDLNDSQNDDWGDTSVSFRRNAFSVSKSLLMGLNVGGVAPTSKESSKMKNSQGSVSVGMSLSADPKALIAGLGIVGTASISRNFHQYETDINGKVLSQYSSTQSLALSYEWPVGVGVSATFIHRNGLTYQNNIRESFELTEELGYEITKVFSVAIGHSNSGNALKPNGVDSNIQIVDEDASIVYASGTVSF